LYKAVPFATARRAIKSTIAMAMFSVLPDLGNVLVANMSHTAAARGKSLTA
jgi:hypothetical protein